MRRDSKIRASPWGSAASPSIQIELLALRDLKKNLKNYFRLFASFSNSIEFFFFLSIVKYLLVDVSRWIFSTLRYIISIFLAFEARNSFEIRINDGKIGKRRRLTRGRVELGRQKGSRCIYGWMSAVASEQRFTFVASGARVFVFHQRKTCVFSPLRKNLHREKFPFFPNHCSKIEKEMIHPRTRTFRSRISNFELFQFEIVLDYRESKIF